MCLKHKYNMKNKNVCSDMLLVIFEYFDSQEDVCSQNSVLIYNDCKSLQNLLCAITNLFKSINVVWITVLLAPFVCMPFHVKLSTTIVNCDIKFDVVVVELLLSAYFLR